MIAWNAMNRRQQRRAEREHLQRASNYTPDEINDRLFMALPVTEIPNVVPPVDPNARCNRLTNRMMLEYCCGPESRLGHARFADRGCAVVRLTSDIDMRTDTGLQYAMDQVEGAHKDGLQLSIWASLPCTAGTPWFRINSSICCLR